MTATGPAGGRPASSLSRRRTQFKGPPPSFYRSGGWGTQSRKRQAHADTVAAAAAAAAAAASQSGGGGGGGRGGYAPYDANTNDVPHFDREGHFRTQKLYEQRWRSRRQHQHHQQRSPTGDIGGGNKGGDVGGVWLNFVFVTGIITLAVGLPSLILNAFGNSSTTTTTTTTRTTTGTSSASSASSAAAAAPTTTASGKINRVRRREEES